MSLRSIFAVCFFAISMTNFAQLPKPPLPIEFLFGNNRLYFQLVVKNTFGENSRFGFFTVATYNANYRNVISENRMVMPVQFNYSLGRGFGVMAGTDINSFSGFSPIIGPHYNFVSKKFLIVTVLSFFTNRDKDFKFFGLYEFKPPISSNWALYTRMQMVYNVSLSSGAHNQSYIYLRLGLKYGALVVGVGANLDRSGPFKKAGANYGLFGRYEFK
ncbi:MAG: hypothetical protein KDC80_16815 [Saprospiraceae bacterium]|nr:hypothetical protein [Saprospiraceae bacterium]